jgi:hypothetical protein
MMHFSESVIIKESALSRVMAFCVTTRLTILILITSLALIVVQTRTLAQPRE